MLQLLQEGSPVQICCFIITVVDADQRRQKDNDRRAMAGQPAHHHQGQHSGSAGA
ncbi:hypothetical protein D3C86_2191340 [compost metagenome]